MPRTTRLNNEGQLRCQDPSCATTQCFICEKEERKQKRDEAARKRKEEEEDAQRALVRTRERCGHVFDFTEPDHPVDQPPAKKVRQEHVDVDDGEDDEDQGMSGDDTSDDDDEGAKGMPVPVPDTTGLPVLEVIKRRLEACKQFEEHIARDLEQHKHRFTGGGLAKDDKEQDESKDKDESKVWGCGLRCRVIELTVLQTTWTHKTILVLLSTMEALNPFDISSKSVAENWNSVASAMCESTKALGEFAVHCNGAALRVYYGRLKTRLANLVNVDAKKSGQAGYEKVFFILIFGSEV